MANIAVLGAGLMGRFVALALKDSHRVSLFEKDTLDTLSTTGRIAAAMLAPVSESVDAGRNVVAMGHASVSLWPVVLSALDIDLAVQANGTLVVAHRQDMGDYVHFKNRVRAAIATSENICLELTTSDIQSLEPELNGAFQQGLLIPGEGHIDNGELFNMTSACIRNSNMTLYEGTEVKLRNDRVYWDKKTQTFDWVIDCRGTGSRGQLANPEANLRGVRGEVLRVRAPEVNLTRQIRLMHPRYPLYIVPKQNGEYVIGATQIESDNSKAMTVRSALELLTAAYSLHTGFAEAEILSMHAGLRPTLDDNEPQIIVKPGLMQINGLYRHGFMITPYVLFSALQWLKQQGVSSDIPWPERNVSTHHPSTHLVVSLND